MCEISDRRRSSEATHGKEDGRDKKATVENTRNEKDLSSKVGVLLGVGLHVP